MNSNLIYLSMILIIIFSNCSISEKQVLSATEIENIITDAKKSTELSPAILPGSFTSFANKEVGGELLDMSTIYNRDIAFKVLFDGEIEKFNSLNRAAILFDGISQKDENYCIITNYYSSEKLFKTQIKELKKMKGLKHIEKPLFSLTSSNKRIISEHSFLNLSIYDVPSISVSRIYKGNDASVIMYKISGTNYISGAKNTKEELFGMAIKIKRNKTSTAKSYKSTVLDREEIVYRPTQMINNLTACNSYEEVRSILKEKDFLCWHSIKSIGGIKLTFLAYPHVKTEDVLTQKKNNSEMVTSIFFSKDGKKDISVSVSKASVVDVLTELSVLKYESESSNLENLKLGRLTYFPPKSSNYVNITYDISNEKTKFTN